MVASEASAASEVQIDLRLVSINLDYPAIHVHMASNINFEGLWGHDGLQTA